MTWRFWLTEKEYSQRFGISRQTLTNWRWADRQAGRDGAEPGKPFYIRLGRSVRYRVTEDGSPELAKGEAA